LQVRQRRKPAHYDEDGDDNDRNAAALEKSVDFERRGRGFNALVAT
jgi:hypothetical protein